MFRNIGPIIIFFRHFLLKSMIMIERTAGIIV
jgi:hypothetical protein